jgi:hypothetical protein
MPEWMVEFLKERLDRIEDARRKAQLLNLAVSSGPAIIEKFFEHRCKRI